MKHQKATWGDYSEQIHDYTSKGLVHDDGIPKEGRESRLWKMMDPFTYRRQLTLPKLMIVGANDPYWTVDAMSIYWDDLVGPKYALRLPNAGHGLEEGREHALRTLGVFFRHAVSGRPFPQIDWEAEKGEGEMSLSMTSNVPAQAARLWYATSPTNDFRESKWQAQLLSGSGGEFSGSVEQNGEHMAVFGELQFEYEQLPYSLSTLVYWR